MDDLETLRLDFKRPPVFLVGGVNLVRTLGLAGLDAIVASWDPDEPAFASRYCRARVLVPRPDGGHALADALDEIGRRVAGRLGRRIPLVCGGDDALRVIQSDRERLGRHFLFLLPDPEVACALIAKDRFAAFSRHRGLPTPRSLAWSGDGPGSVRGTAGDVLVKPSDKVDWHHSSLCHQLFGGDGKARVYPSGAAAADDPVVADNHARLTFQEYVPGGDEALWSFHGFADASGNVLASFIGRKIRTYPVGMGESAFVELARAPDLEAAGREVALRCPLKGFFKMDFKQDPRDGRWHLLEINARCTLWHYLGAVNGVNLMQVAYDHLVHARRPEPREARTGIRWLSLQLDAKAWRELAARGELSLAAWLFSITATRKVCNVFSWSDPGPWLSLYRQRIARRLQRVPRRFLTALRPWRSTAS